MFKELIICSIFLISATQSQFTDTQNATAFTLYFYKFFPVQENIVVSPISLRILLSILYQNANGATEKELCDNLYLNDKRTTLQEQKLTINKLNQSPNLKIINKIFLKETARPNHEFLNAIGQYQSSFENINLKRKAETVNRINKWVSDETNGLIRNLLTEDVLTDDLAVLLLNTIYFKAQWLEPFDKNFVFKSDFIDANNFAHKIDFMSNTGDYRYTRHTNLKADILELPYRTESNFVFWIILPNKKTTLGNVQHTLNYEIFKQINDDMKLNTLDIYLPKFEIESLIDAKSVLKNVGLRSIFEKSELSLLEGNDRLKVDDIKQKTKIIVNTDGTEAATASYIKAVTLSARPVFQVDRPFIFCVLTADTKLPLFIGHYSRPQ